MTVPLTHPIAPLGRRTFAQPLDQPRIWYEPPTGITVNTALLREGPLRTFNAAAAVCPAPAGFIAFDLLLAPAVGAAGWCALTYAAVTQPTLPLGSWTLYQPLLYPRMI